MTAQRTTSECKDIVLSLLRKRGAMSLRDLRAASPLDKGEVARTINALQRTRIVQRIASDDDRPGVVGRYELTGKVPRARNEARGNRPCETDFNALLAVWGIALPTVSPWAYSYRVIRNDDQDEDSSPDHLLNLAPTPAAPSRRGVHA